MLFFVTLLAVCHIAGVSLFCVMNKTDKNSQKPKPEVLAFGEVLFDCLGDDVRLGGAPLNFAYYCVKSGARASVLSAVGQDALGDRALREIASLGVGVDYIARLKKPTGRAIATINSDGVAEYEILSPVAWDEIVVEKSALDFASRADVFAFGSLAQRQEASRRALWETVTALNRNCVKFFDANLRQKYYDTQTLSRSAQIADILKINEDELKVFSEIFSLGTGTDLDRARRLFEMFNLKILVLTLGENGSVILEANSEFRIPAERVKLVDTVGAGDSFSARFVCGILSGESVERSAREASKLAAEVCSAKGAII